MQEIIDIIIPTCKTFKQIKPYLKKIEETINGRFLLLPTCLQTSAATNRNYGLTLSSSKIVIMMDDDLTGFYKGWADQLIKPLQDKKDVMMVSARLMKSKSKTGVMMNIKPDLSKPLVTIEDRILPSACIAFCKDDTRFDENYGGAGFEDTDFCFQLNEKYPDKEYLINNDVQLIHKNEMKNQMGGHYQKNGRYFHRKWNIK